MKIRNGFISNSSTSNYIIVGFKPSRDLYKFLLDSIPSDTFHNPDIQFFEEGIIGKVIAETSDNIIKLDIDFYNQIVPAKQALVNAFGEQISDQEFSLYAGAFYG